MLTLLELLQIRFKSQTWHNMDEQSQRKTTLLDCINSHPILLNYFKAIEASQLRQEATRLMVASITYEAKGITKVVKAEQERMNIPIISKPKVRRNEGTGCVIHYPLPCPQPAPAQSIKKETPLQERQFTFNAHQSLSIPRNSNNSQHRMVQSENPFVSHKKFKTQGYSLQAEETPKIGNIFQEQIPKTKPVGTILKKSESQNIKPSKKVSRIPTAVFSGSQPDRYQNYPLKMSKGESQWQQYLNRLKNNTKDKASKLKKVKNPQSSVHFSSLRCSCCESDDQIMELLMERKRRREQRRSRKQDKTYKITASPLYPLSSSEQDQVK